MNLFETEPVQVVARQQTDVDGMGMPVHSWAPEGDPVLALVAPGTSSDVVGSIRPDGVEIAYTLHWPKSDTRSLRGKRVEVRGEQLAVVGDPRPFTPGNTPGDFNRPVQVRVVDG